MKNTNCENCEYYGVWRAKNEKLLVPCVICAFNNNFIWGNKSCLGSYDVKEVSLEWWAKNRYITLFLDSKIKHQIKKLAEKEDINIIDYIKKQMPEGSHYYFDKLIYEGEDF